MVVLRSRRCAFGRDGHAALKSNPDGTVQANSFGVAKEWEQWNLCSIVDTHDDQTTYIALQACSTGKYLSAKLDGSVCADADEIDCCEMWQVVCSNSNDDSGFVRLKSHFGTYLSNKDFRKCQALVSPDKANATKHQEWMIVSDPTAMTNPGKTMRRAMFGTVAAVGSIVTLGAVAIPLVGFSVGGVTAGSVAACVQSAVYGGATCGVFSVLQSAGATLAWVPFAAGGGAVTAASSLALRKENTNNKNDESIKKHEY